MERAIVNQNKNNNGNPLRRVIYEPFREHLMRKLRAQFVGTFIFPIVWKFVFVNYGEHILRLRDRVLFIVGFILNNTLEYIVRATLPY